MATDVYNGGITAHSEEGSGFNRPFAFFNGIFHQAAFCSFLLSHHYDTTICGVCLGFIRVLSRLLNSSLLSSHVLTSFLQGREEAGKEAAVCVYSRAETPAGNRLFPVFFLTFGNRPRAK